MIDAHIHVVSPQLPGCGPLSDVLRLAPEMVAQSIREEMAACGARRAFAMGEMQCTDEDPLGVRRTLGIAETVPGLAAIGVADPKRDPADQAFFKQVERALKDPRVVALKVYLGYLHYAPDHATYRRYYELAAKARVPVVFHTGDTYSPLAKLKYAHPLGVDDVAVDHRDTRFVLAHLGNPWTVDAAEVIYKNMNVWADLSGLAVGPAEIFTDEEYQDGLADTLDRVRKAFRYAERPNRFVFGSDWPLVPILAYREFIASAIPPVHHEQIFDENAELLFRAES